MGTSFPVVPIVNLYLRIGSFWFVLRIPFYSSIWNHLWVIFIKIGLESSYSHYHMALKYLTFLFMCCSLEIFPPNSKKKTKIKNVLILWGSLYSITMKKKSTYTRQLIEQYLNRGVRIGKERDRRHKIESGGLSVNTAAASNLFLVPFLYPKQKREGKRFPYHSSRNEQV